VFGRFLDGMKSARPGGAPVQVSLAFPGSGTRTLTAVARHIASEKGIPEFIVITVTGISPDSGPA
jgi:hypothetical protein